MQAEMPFYECPEDAMRAAVQALGGAKEVGVMLWPDATPDTAGRKLHDALNPARPEKLELSQIMLVLARAKEAGCHGPFQWLASRVGYEARPVTRAEEVDRVTEVVEQSTKTLAAALATLERLQRASSIKAVN